MKYRIIILIIIIISLGQILLSYIANTSHTHTWTCARSHTHTAIAVQVVAVRCIGGTKPWRSYAPFRWIRWRSIAGRLFIQINTRAGDAVSPRFWVFFTYNTFAGPNWDMNSWQDVLPVDTNSLRHLPRRSSKSCDLQFTNSDIFKEIHQKVASSTLWNEHNLQNETCVLPVCQPPGS